ncbi:16S rRNA (uracil(1498)-N(3))-methyltransferase [Arthrobacter sp. zg-Y40]|uniref:16S rRNA (uracil(1498)-N(3))-methyltransferase n=1 Tax=unclassified Arthrobacter TaxID=235627 RepID=UPI001D13FB11|nr:MULTISPECIES: 16S rRNA (uracil(1498)-N(3))-methyltransferase [unclassified Arthrobacter]MCC3274830.1 16S rRNA (uracil(1498)-N(3))-methyltransferase [Arthrobacter sp. zg-Y20]MCC3279200.1 16S rRNA (uracil(1498)-N(3))-methyltransferase [Arthrobacter sp. zg-Y40]MDK1314986.1 16S rRNA (uracil(1498)-N(3))-methyltransferase [Arthrobacter sp. zg.Y20]WIB04838.1 16S rRNA (uracil(1498)-N(3))-methyltransferase [Arthrobacter sp. zg-Y20]
MTNPIFFGDPELVAAVRPGGSFRLEGPEARHAVSVKRIAPGEPVDVVDGAGRRITGTVTVTGPSLLELAVEAVTQEPAEAERLVLVQALAKGDRDEQAVEAATELGVDAVIPWQSDRSIVRWRTEKAAKGQAKWQALTAAAAKQSRRSRIPEVEPLLDSKALVRRLSDLDLVLVLHEEADAPLAGALAALGDRRAGPAGPDAAQASIAVVVGPEGGISPAELEQLRAAGAVAVRLGPHVLRSSTAGPSALAVLNQLLGRW